MPSTKEITVYKFEELSEEAQQRVKETLMSEYFYGTDAMQTLKLCVNAMGFKMVNYEIDFYNNTSDITLSFMHIADLGKALADMKELNLSGFCLEYDFFVGVSQAFHKGITKDMKELCEYGIWQLLKSAHLDFLSQFEDSYVKEHCDANEYQFLANGSLA